MNTEQIIKLGYEAGLCDEEGADEDCIYIHKHLARFVELVLAVEREACAQLCDEVHNKQGFYECGQASECSEAIRARK